MTELKKVFTPLTLSLYGIGSILGAGIYTIIGEVASVAGPRLWLPFLVAMSVSLLTAFSYAELSSLYPKSGAEAYFVSQSLKKKWLSSLTGWLVFSASLVSMATLSHAFAGYLQSLFPQIPDWIIFIPFLAILGSVNWLGIQESSRANLVATSIEMSGLILVLVAGLSLVFQGGSQPVKPDFIFPEISHEIGLFQGVALAFFAFIGFEDLANVAEEVKNPKKTLPIAIVTAPLVAGSLYILVAWVCGRVVPWNALAGSETPLLEVIRRSSLSIPSLLFVFISLFAVSNTALLNSITASRLLYGMSHQGLLPRHFQKIHSRRQTPHWAILFVIVVAVILALLGSLASLAGTTSLILLLVFFMVNLSLVAIKIRGERGEKFRVPIFFPILGGFANVAVMFFVPRKSHLTGAVILLAGILLFGVYRLWKIRKST